MKVFSKSRTSVSSCLLGMTHTPEPMALLFHKLFFSRAKFLLFMWQTVFAFQQVCSPRCSVALTGLKGFSGGSQLGTTFHFAPRSGPCVPCKFYISSQRLPELPSALCSAEYLVITSYEIKYTILATFLPSVPHWQDIFLSCKDQLRNSPGARFAVLGGPAVSPGLSLIPSLF